MTDISRRRRGTGLLLVGAAALLVPLTASFSYAQDAVPEPPLPPAAPAAPDAPAAPLPPAPGDSERVIIRELAPGGENKSRSVVIFRRDKDGKDAPLAADGDHDMRVFHLEMELDDKKLEEMGVRLGKLGEDIAGKTVMIDRRIALSGAKMAEAHAHAARGLAAVPMVVADCAESEGRKESTTPDGKRVVRICRKEMHGSGAHGSGVIRLRMARSQIAGQAGMDEATRAEVLRSLDREIERLEAAK